MDMFGKRIGLIFFVVLVLGAYGSGFYIGKNQAQLIPIEGVTNLEIGKPGDVDFSLFWDSWRQIQEKYAKSSSINPQDLVYGAIRGMVASLQDPYTVFMDPKEAKTFLDDISGSFEGVGMEIGIKKGILTVIAPLEGTPAQKAGIRAGDMILKIGDKNTDGLNTEEAVMLIRGPRGSIVKLSVMRTSWEKPMDIEITRAVIEVPSLKWELKDGDIAYIRLFQFSEKSARDFQKAAGEIKNSSAKKIVLDLRNNPGGYLEIAQYIAGWFLDRGQLVVVEDFSSQAKKQEYRAEGPSRLVSYPMVVLINEGSASASEILAGALRDNRNVKLVGVKSFGKGSVQELQNLQDGSSLKITVANWLTPKGTLINGQGLEPDVKVEAQEKDLEEGKDVQLDKAIEIVKGL
ncbi:MAG: S41 family peptidase [Parcubacteria group bacterium]|nr:S41 family peptidase [Parcubacteria group bacterium]